MADIPPYPVTEEGTSEKRRPGSRPGMPRWVKMFSIVVIVLVLLVVALLLFGPDQFGPGQHGPGRHMPSAQAVTSYPIQDARSTIGADRLRLLV
ncbi:MAG: hypothetical protein ACR2FO_01175 [Actinomycetota bacterium]